jgi:hypothetical protein
VALRGESIMLILLMVGLYLDKPVYNGSVV